MKHDAYIGIPRLGEPTEATYRYFCDMQAWRIQITERLAALGLNPRRDIYAIYAQCLSAEDKKQLDVDTLRAWFQPLRMGDTLPISAPLSLVAVFDAAVKRASAKDLAVKVLNILRGTENTYQPKI